MIKPEDITAKSGPYPPWAHAEGLAVSVSLQLTYGGHVQDVEEAARELEYGRERIWRTLYGDVEQELVKLQAYLPPAGLALTLRETIDLTKGRELIDKLLASLKNPFVKKASDVHSIR